jgi:hypothetical protein
MSRGPGRPPKLIAPEVLTAIEQCLDEGWPFLEITRTYGIGYHRLNRLFPGRQWTNKQAGEWRAMSGRLERVGK